MDAKPMPILNPIDDANRDAMPPPPDWRGGHHRKMALTLTSDWQTNRYRRGPSCAKRNMRDAECRQRATSARQRSYQPVSATSPPSQSRSITRISHVTLP
ncbi:hypothetical protein GCM10007904_35390 [Oharaeibacter diazotrophicus]|nr:hypothetical protein GCM10007904_35390 [Oharaeibacter diazotrophicus]